MFHRNQIVIQGNRIDQDHCDCAKKYKARDIHKYHLRSGRKIIVVVSYQGKLYNKNDYYSHNESVSYPFINHPDPLFLIDENLPTGEH